MTEVFPGLFLGSFQDANDKTLYDKYNFSLVVNCTKNLHFFDDMRTNLRLSVDDIGNKEDVEKLAELLLSTCVEISKHLDAKGCVLVHCQMGRQRSATVVAAFLIYKKIVRDSLSAIEFVKSKRREAFFPVPNFIDSLNKFIINEF